VVITDGAGRLLVQRRADGKYHSPHLWSNTACGHPRPGEAAAAAAARRLREEMGVVCPLEPLTVFRYRADVGGGLVEHEIDHLFIGQCADAPVPDHEEVGAWRWMDAPAIEDELAHTPRRWTRWAPLILERYFRATRATRAPRAARSLWPTLS
jgi:isopentenyl-diphosphate delta-isomerase